MVWSRLVLQKLVAQEISEFRTAEIPDLEEQHPDAKYWLANHFLNSALRAQYGEGFRQAALGYLRRSTHAYEAHLDARKRTLNYLDNTDPQFANLVPYYRAVAAWENFAMQSAMALDLFKWMNNGDGAFRKLDGSILYRIYTIANHVKHAASCIESGQCTTDDVLPLWLTEVGLKSFDNIEVTYLETALVFDELAELANVLQDPLTFAKH